MPQNPQQAERWAKCLEAAKLITENNDFKCTKQHVYNALKDLKKQKFSVEDLITGTDGAIDAFKQLCTSGKVYGYGDPRQFKPVKVKKAAESLKDDQVIHPKTGEVLTKYDLMKITYWYVNMLGGIERAMKYLAAVEKAEDTLKEIGEYNFTKGE